MMTWLFRQHPATALGSKYVELEFKKLQGAGGGEAMLTETMILEVSPEQGLDFGYIYNVGKCICGIVKRREGK